MVCSARRFPREPTRSRENTVHPHPLVSLAELLCAVTPLDGSLLVRVDEPPPVEPDDELILGTRPLDGHPRDALLGFVAPDEWWALGLVCPGWANPASDPLTEVDAARGRRHGAPYADRPERRRVRAVSLVARDGTEVSRLVLGDDPPLDPGEQAGLLPDCLRRALALPTPPPAMPTAELFAGRWLAAIAAAGRRGCRRVGWAEAAALHPVCELVGVGRIAHAELRGAARALASVGWSDVRAAVVDGRWAVDDLSPDLAAWMDDGMFARWLLAAQPALSDLLAQAAEVTSAGTMARVRAALPARPAN
jgi:hypothetical protein